MLFRPSETVEFLLGANALPYNVEHEHLLGMLAAGLAGGAAASWALKVRPLKSSRERGSSGRGSPCGCWGLFQ